MSTAKGHGAGDGTTPDAILIRLRSLISVTVAPAKHAHLRGTELALTSAVNKCHSASPAAGRNPAARPWGTIDLKRRRQALLTGECSAC